MAESLAFWGAAMLTAVAALPLSAALFRRMPDAGAGLSPALGLLLTGYGYFILRTVGILPAGRGGFLLALLLFATVGLVVALRSRSFLSTLRRAWPVMLLLAGLFMLAFFATLNFRSYEPTIAGTEQPMDFMYLNSALNSPTYPPHDPWLAGESASYYYFGYVQAAVLTGVSGVPASIGYNLALAYTFAAAAVAAASLAAALARWILGGRGRTWAMAAAGFAVALLLFVGSLSAVFEWSAAHNNYNRGLYETFGVENLIPCEPGQTDRCYPSTVQPRTSAWYPTEFWFWWRTSRVIPDTITEFPAFSFLLGDLHPHVMAIPVVLLAVAFAANTWRGRGPLSFATHRRRPAPGIVLAVLLGGLAFQNAWDVITFTGLISLAVLVRNLRALPLAARGTSEAAAPVGPAHGIVAGRTSTLPRVLSAGSAIPATLGYLVPVFALALVAYLPWLLDFSSQAAGLYPYVRAGTRPGQAVLQFGPLLLSALVTLTWAVRREDLPRLRAAVTYTVWLPITPVILWAIFAAYQGDYSAALSARTAGGWVTLASYCLSVWALGTTFVTLALQRRAAAPVLGLATVGALLLLGAELFVIRDVFFNSVPRLNTVFKLGYQAWLLLSIAGGVALAVALQRLVIHRRPVALAALPALLAVILGLTFPLIAVPNRTGGFTGPTSIDGLSGLALANPDEYALVRWIEANTSPSDIIIEASGRTWARNDKGDLVITAAGTDYTDSARIGSRTGRQTPVGWYFHEIQWRGDSPEMRDLLTRRQDQADAPYIAPDPQTALSAVRAAGARYLVVGSIERKRFTSGLPDFAQSMELVFEQGEVRVYRVPVLEAEETL